MINNIDINEIVISTKFAFYKQDLKHFSDYKYNKEIRPLCIFIPKMSIYKRYSDKSKNVYSVIRWKNLF